MGLGLKLGQLRLGHGQSLQEVADAVKVSKAHIWELEKERTDNPSMALVTRLADHFKVSIGYLIDEDLTSPGADDTLVRMFRRAQELDPDDLMVVDEVMRSLLSRRKDRNGN